MAGVSLLWFPADMDQALRNGVLTGQLSGIQARTVDEGGGSRLLLAV